MQSKTFLYLVILTQCSFVDAAVFHWAYFKCKNPWFSYTFQARTQNKHVTSASLKCEKISTTMVGRRKNFLILDGLKHSYIAFPRLRYSVKIDNDFDEICHGLVCYYGFNVQITVVE